MSFMVRSIPNRLMFHKIDIYNATVAADTSGGMSRTYPSKPTYSQVPSFVQPAVSEVTLLYARRDEIVTHSIFLTVNNKTEFNSLTTNSRIVYSGKDYLVKGTRNLSNLDRVYQVDVREEIE